MTTDLFRPWTFGELRSGAYRVILADPPWEFEHYTNSGGRKAPQRHYTCMSTAAIQALPVRDLAADNCALVMWACAPMLPEAIATLTAWGFTFKSAGAWAKQSSTGQKWAFGTGYCYRGAAEFWLLGTRGAPVQKVRDVRNLIIAPIREHSRKPDQMRTQCERLWDGPRVELFAREAAPGWDRWGLETEKFSGEKAA